MKTKLLLLLLLANFSIYAQINLVQNSGFETWTGNIPQSWTVANSVISNADFASGQWSAKLSYTTVSPKITTQVPMKAGVTYTVKYKYKYIQSNYGGDHPIALNISKAGSSTTLSSSTFATNNLWTSKETTFTPDADLSYDLSFSTFSFDSATFYVLIDDVEVYVQGTEQYTLIPDVNFEKKLIALKIDFGTPDGKVPTNNVNKLTSLNISSSSITDLTGIEDFTALTSLNCAFNNTIQKLNLSKNTALTNLSAQYNSLSTVDLSQNTLLTDVMLHSNSLTALDIAANKSLISLTCNSNKLSVLDLSNNLKLKTLDCSNNQLKSLDVKNHPDLETLRLGANAITALDVTQNLALQNLDCRVNDLKILDLRKNVALTKLDVSSNEITILDLKANTNLIFLNCESNPLTSFDVSSNKALEYLKCGNNGSRSTILANLDLSANTKLIELSVSQATFSGLDLSKNTALKMLDLQRGKLSSLDLSANTALEVVLVGGNELKALDVSNNKLLQSLGLYSNQLTSLDLSKNTALTYLDCGNNNLSNLNLQNGNNPKLASTGIYFTYFDGRAGSTHQSYFKNNVNLKCIQVDNVAYSNSNWSTLKDAEANFNSLACELSTIISDPVFEDKLIALQIDKDGKNGAVLNSSINTITTLDLSNSSIVNLTGIEGFTAVETLNISNNLITKVDLSKNTALKTLNASNNTALTCIKVADLESVKSWNITKDPAASLSLDCEVYTLIPDSKFEDVLISLKIDRDGKNGKVKTESISNILYMNELSLKGITDLTGIEDFKSLIQLDVSRNNLTSLDVSNNQALTNLNASGNKIENVKLPTNNTLTSLTLNSNNITAVNLSNHANLMYVDLRANKLATLDLSKNIKIKDLDVSKNQLVTLDIKANTELTQLTCYTNNIRTLDISKNSKLTSANLGANKLVNLNVKNGKNTLLTYVNFTENPNLTCIQVDDLAFSNQNWATKKDLTAAFSQEACPVVVPYTLIPDPKFEDKLIALQIDKDGKNGKVSTLSIAVLTSLNVSGSGITDLTGIEDFNSLTSLDCSNNALTAVNFSKNISLTTLNISKNKLTAFNASEMLSLTSLNCSNNALTSLNLTKIYYGNDSQLVTVDCSSNAIKDLNTKNSIGLTNLNCTKNELTALDLSNNAVLTSLSVSFNKIKYLDVSKNTKLKEFDCAANNMYTLNVKNGNNANMKNMIFGNFTENPNLACIQVDNAAFSTENWIAKDAKATYSTEACPENFQYTLIPDPNFERILISQGIDKDGPNGKVLTSSIENLTQLSALDLTNKVTDLSGIEDFKALERLSCYHGALTKLDVSKNLKLKYLDIADNKISTLDLSKNTALETLDCNSNNLTELNVSANTSLKSLNAYSNSLTTIDVSNNIALETLAVFTNKITSVNVAANVNLKSLQISNNQIKSIDISNNLALTTLSISNNEIKSIDISLHTNLNGLYAKQCQLTSVNVSNNSQLLNLEISGNKITTIDVSKNPLLQTLMLDSNELTSVDFRNGKNNLINNNYISFRSNAKLYCILVDNVTYANTNWLNKKDPIATYNTECTGELVLPANNFTVETKGESCLGENNGEISIVAKTAFDYVATVNDKPYTFTNNSLKVTALVPGVYQIKITIPNIIFEQNFTVTIVKGATIAGKSSIASKKVDIEITEGTAPFTVFVDGTEQFQTTDSNFSVELSEGGLIEVATAKACEGVYAKKVKTTEILGTVLSAYPNPTSGNFEIEIPTDKNEITIELYNFGGQLVSRKAYVIENGTAKLNLENQPSGIYAAKIYLETPEYIKIIKK
ncbi:Internalin-J precursor [compost metagenome]